MKTLEVYLIDKNNKSHFLDESKYKLFHIRNWRHHISYNLSKLHLSAFGSMIWCAYSKLRRDKRSFNKHKISLISRTLALDLNSIEKILIKTESKEIHFHTLGNPEFIGIYIEYMDGIMIKNQYNLSSELLFDKTVVDGGANLGFFSVLGAAFFGAKKIYSFEPILSTYEILKKNVALNRLDGIVIPLNKALGDKSEILEMGFEEQGDFGASFNRRNTPSTQKVQVVMLDEFLNEKIDFIKLDVEGYEENVFKGAAATIKKYTPVLSFSAYHKPSDKEVLPRTIKEICPQYVCTLLKRAEEDFFCTTKK